MKEELIDLNYSKKVAQKNCLGKRSGG